MFKQQELTWNVPDNTWHACHQHVDCGNSGENEWMLPLQLEIGQVAGPHSAGSSPGRLANENKILIQSSCFHWRSTTCVEACPYVGWRIHNTGSAQPATFQLLVNPDLWYQYSNTLKSTFSTVYHTYDIWNPIFEIFQKSKSTFLCTFSGKTQLHDTAYPCLMIHYTSQNIISSWTTSS